MLQCCRLTKVRAEGGSGDKRMNLPSIIHKDEELTLDCAAKRKKRKSTNEGGEKQEEEKSPHAHSKQMRVPDTS